MIPAAGTPVPSLEEPSERAHVLGRGVSALSRGARSLRRNARALRRGNRALSKDACTLSRVAGQKTMYILL